MELKSYKYAKKKEENLILDEILVSIRCITFNHAFYLKDALNSFINQRTTFKYEIIVHDDASTDGTTEILRAYEKKYPNLIRAFYEEKNLHSQKRLSERMNVIDKNETRGKYIAYCEGDDFWIDNNKLQIQVDYMERHPEYAMTGHNVIIADSKNNTVMPMDGFNEEQDVTTEEIILNSKMCFQTSSFMIRKSVLDQHIDLLQDCTIGDWPLKLVASTCGKVHYFDRVMSVYRYCHGGAWSDTVNRNAINHMRYRLSMIRYFSRFNEYTHNHYSQLINDQIKASLLEIVSYNSKLTMDEFKRLCDIARIDNLQNEPYIDQLTILKKESENAEEDLINFISKHEKIYIMGAGQNGEELANQLKVLNLSYEGFVVSNDQALKENFLGKNVCHLKDIAEDAENIGILIAIKRNLKEIIEKSIESNHIYNYFWPLM